MGDLVYLNDYRPCVLMPDGGKARIRARREVVGLTGTKIIPDDVKTVTVDLVMDHADPECSFTAA